MAELAVNSMQWSRLKDISSIKPIDDVDAPCLNEIREVLDRHGCLDRFGVTLLHSHFELADDEMMLETTNSERREHWVRPVKRSSFAEAGMEVQTTVLGFDKYGYRQNCGCNPRPTGHHHL